MSTLNQAENMSEERNESGAETERRPFSHFVNTAKLAGAAIVSQLITFGGTLINAHLYGPDAFGLFGLFNGVLGVALFAASWRYELAIVTTEAEEKAQDVALFVCTAGLSSAAAFSLGLLVVDMTPDAFGLSTSLRRTLAGIPLVLLLSSIILAGTNLCVRRRQFGRVALQQIVLALVTVASQASLVGASTPGGGLVAGFVLGQIAATATLAAPVMRVLRERIYIPTVWGRLRATAREHYRYFFYVVPYSLLNQLYVQGPIFLLGSFSTIADVGLFSLAYRTTTTPLGLVPTAVAQVLFPEIARDHKRLSKWGPSIQALFGGLGILYSPAIAMIIAFGPEVYSIGLGEQWKGAGAFAQIVIFPNMLVMLCTGYDRLYFILNRQRTALLLTLIACIPSAVFMWAGYRLGEEPRWLIVGWAIAQVGTSLVWIGIASHFCGFSLRGLAREVAIVIGSVIAMTAVFAEAWQTRLVPFEAAGLLLSTVLIYIVVLWRVIRPLRILLQKPA
jgi:O-antigen/teichoic acid export membrane protein